MKHALHLAAAMFAATLLTAGSSSASVLVLGDGLAGQCSLEALRPGASSIGVSVCNQALRDEALSPRERAATFVNRGVLRLRTRAFDQAIADFNSALRINPNLGEALVNRGAARIGQQRYSDALSDLERGASLGATEPEKAWFNRGLAHEGLGDLPAAWRAYSQAAALKPDWEAPRKELARFTVRPAH